MLLEPGDVILTGTPEGVALSGRFPYLQDGDVVDLEIEGLGRQRQTYVSTPVPRAPVRAGATPAPAPAPK
jgi:2-keto-4-pentenoate hydratase/2-oxohepta-3-ene-1,7-dioic acid hydratase in catechol pathway